MDTYSHMYRLFRPYEPDGIMKGNAWKILRSRDLVVLYALFDI